MLSDLLRISSAVTSAGQLWYYIVPIQGHVIHGSAEFSSILSNRSRNAISNEKSVTPYLPCVIILVSIYVA